MGRESLNWRSRPLAAFGMEAELLRSDDELAFGWSERENSVAQHRLYEAFAGSSLRR